MVEIADLRPCESTTTIPSCSVLKIVSKKPFSFVQPLQVRLQIGMADPIQAGEELVEESVSSRRQEQVAKASESAFSSQTNKMMVLNPEDQPDGGTHIGGNRR